MRDDVYLSGGSGYTVNDVLTLDQGTPVSGPLQVTVTSVDGDNGDAVLTCWAPTNVEYYNDALPPVDGSTWTGGTGSGFTVKLQMGL